MKYGDVVYSPGYGQIKEAFGALTKDYILQTYISGNHFGSTENGNDVGYNSYVLDLRYQKKLKSAEPIKVEFKFSEIIPTGIYGYALVLTNKLVSIGSDGQ